MRLMAVACARRGERPASATPAKLLSPCVSKSRRSIMNVSIACRGGKAAQDCVSSDPAVSVQRKEPARAATPRLLSGEGVCAEPAPSLRAHELHALCRCEANGGLKSIAAGLAFLEMPHAAGIDVFRPFRYEQPLAALR